MLCPLSIFAALGQKNFLNEMNSEPFQLLKFNFISANSLRCYVCDGFDFLCTVGLLGEKTECHPEVKHCYKSWTGLVTPNERSI